MAKAKLTGFQPAINNQTGQQKTWQGNNGLMYYFTVQFSDGTSGEAGSTKDKPSWKIGEEYTFETEVNQYGTKIKGMKSADAPQGGFGGKGGSTYKPKSHADNVLIASMNATTAAVTFYAQRTTASTADVLSLANEILVFNLTNYKKAKEQEAAATPPQQPVTPPVHNAPVATVPPFNQQAPHVYQTSAMPDTNFNQQAVVNDGLPF